MRPTAAHYLWNHFYSCGPVFACTTPFPSPGYRVRVTCKVRNTWTDLLVKVARLGAFTRLAMVVTVYNIPIRENVKH